MTPYEWATDQLRKIEAGEYDPDCTQCDRDMHRCPGCGTPTNHKHRICKPCNEEYEVELRKAYEG